MPHKPGCLNKNKLVWFILACLLFASCSPLTPTRVPGISTTTPEPTPVPSPAWDSKPGQYGSLAFVDRFVEGAGPTIFLFSPDRRFQTSYRLTGEYDPLQVQQVTDDCDLVILAKSSESHKLIRLGWAGVNEQEIFSLENTRRDESLYIPLLSRTGKYVSYVVFSGELYYDTAQYQDVEVVSLDDPGRPVRLTSHGGAWQDGGVWSPDGTELAYTDYDEQSVLHVYIARMGSGVVKRQITHFKDPGLKAGPISWSPVGDRLAVVLRDEGQGDSVWIVRAQGGSAFALDLPYGKFPIDDPVWSEDGSRLLLSLGYHPDTELYWFDVNNNRLLHMLTLKDVSRLDPGASSFSYMFPLTTDLSRIVFHNGWDKWYLYDAAHRQLEEAPWLETRQWGSHVEISLFQNDLFACKQLPQPAAVSPAVLAAPAEKPLPGQYLAYWSQDTWYLRDVAGRNSTQLLPGIKSGFYTEINSSPDGSPIAFSSSAGQVSVYDPGTRRLAVYPNPEIEHAYGFQFLLDGETLLYLGTPEQYWIPDATVGLYSLSLRTGWTSKVIDTDDDRFDYGLDDLRLSPNGKWLAFDTPRLSEYAAPDPEYAVYVMETACLASGTCAGSARLVGDGHRPEWSPDGRLWWSCPNAGQPALCVADLKAPITTEVFAAVSELTGSPQAVFSYLSWSPDGKYVAVNVEVSRSSTSDETRDEVYLVPADKSRPVRITAVTDENEYLEGWSPDSRYLVYSEIIGYTDHMGELGMRFPITDLYLYDFQTGTKIDLVDTPGAREVFGFFMNIK